jgi:hypothetical protein
MSSPFQQKFMAKNPTKGFTLDQLKKASDKAEKQMKKSAAILPQVEGQGNPDYESKDEQKFAGDDTYTYGKKDDSPLNAYVSTAPHFQRLQDNIAAAFTPKKETGPTSEDKKNQAEEAYWKSKTTTSEENNPFKDLTVSAPNSVDLFDTNVNYDNSKDYSGTYEESEKGNSYNIGQGVDKSKNDFYRFE